MVAEQGQVNIVKHSPQHCSSALLVMWKRGDTIAVCLPACLPAEHSMCLINVLLLCLFVCCCSGCLQTVFPDAYRVRILNGCNSRTLQLRFARCGGRLRVCVCGGWG